MAVTVAVEEVVRWEVPDWDDDDVAATARFKAFSGQRSDWEPRFLFWRDLILKVASHLGVCTVRSSEVRNVWFVRGGLTPLCIDRVLLEMHNDGDILLRGDLMDPTSGHFYWAIRRVGQLIGVSKSSVLRENCDEILVLRTLLQDRAADVVKLLAESHWTSSCVVTMEKFRSICKKSDEASVILSYLFESGKARYISIRKKDFIEGVKVFLAPATVSNVSTLDCDLLHLVWTTEKLKQQLDVIDQRWITLRKLAIASLKSGNKQAAYRHLRQSKLVSENRSKCSLLLDRVEEVLDIIANAESTKKVSEAIQIGARAIKENKVDVDEIHICLQEIDESVASQKQVDEALESMSFQYMSTEDEDVEEEFKKLELELGDESSGIQTTEAVGNGISEEPGRNEESTISLSQALSNLNLETA